MNAGGFPCRCGGGGILYGVMSSVAEIEAAIEKLPVPQVDQLAHWVEGFIQRRVSTPDLENWLLNAKGAAVPDAQTQAIMSLTRGQRGRALILDI